MDAFEGGSCMNRRETLAMLAAAAARWRHRWGVTRKARRRQRSCARAASSRAMARELRREHQAHVRRQCREAARLGCYGFDLIAPADWPTLRKHGLEPLLAGAGPVTFQNGIIHPEVHDAAREGPPHVDRHRSRIRAPRRSSRSAANAAACRTSRRADNAVAFLNRIKVTSRIAA